MFTTSRILGAGGVAVAAVLGLGLTGTGAWFTDQETSTVSASAGTVDISLSGDAGTSLTVGNLMPGVESEPYSFNVYNSGSSVPVKYRVTSSFAQNELLEDALRIRVEHGNCVSGGISNVYDIESPTLVRNLNFNSSESIAPTDSLAVNNTHCFELYFSLAPSAGNQFQGESATFNIVVDATQLENPGFNE